MLPFFKNKDMNKFIAFCIFFYALSQGSPRVIIIMATQDIVAGTLMHSSVVMILFASSDTIAKTCSPFLIRKISFPRTTIILAMIWLIAYVLVVASENVPLRLFGILFYGMGNGLTNVLIMMLLGCYNNTEWNASAYQIGSSTSNLLWAFLYIGSTVWQCWSPRVVNAFCLPLAFSAIIFYAILNHGPLKKYQIDEHGKAQQYTSLPLDETRNMQEQFQMTHYLQFLLKVFPFASYMFLGVFTYNLTATSVLTTIAFSSSAFSIRDHFQYYRMAGNVGQVLGGVEMILLSRFSPGCVTSFLTCSGQIWVIVLIHVAHLLFFLCATWYRFVPSVYIILVLSCSHGIFLYVIIVRTLVVSAECFSKSGDRGSALAITQIGCSLGRLIAGILGLFVEEYLRQHCTDDLLMGEYCLTRFSSRAGWNKNLNCV